MHLQDVSRRCFQEVFKTYHQVKLSLLTNLRDVFNTAKKIIYRRICQGRTSGKFMVSGNICKSDKIFSSFSFWLYCTFSWLLTEAYLEPGRVSTVEFLCENIFLSTTFAKKSPSWMFDWVEKWLLAKGLKYWVHSCSQSTKKAEKILSRKICVTPFLKRHKVVLRK